MIKPYYTVLQTYMTALGTSDFVTIKSLFEPDATVVSPLLGEMPVDQFFDKLACTTQESLITPIDIFLSASEQHHATAYFQYDWTLSDGSTTSFKVMDLFVFAPGSERVSRLELIYDTHPMRVSLGGNPLE